MLFIKIDLSVIRSNNIISAFQLALAHLMHTYGPPRVKATHAKGM